MSDRCEACGSEEPCCLTERPATDLADAAKQIETLRARLLLDGDSLAGLSAAAEQHALIALALLEQAHRHMRLADFAQASALAAVQGKVSR